jgi:hypothetical protein
MFDAVEMMPETTTEVMIKMAPELVAAAVDLALQVTAAPLDPLVGVARRRRRNSSIGRGSLQARLEIREPELGRSEIARCLGLTDSEIARCLGLTDSEIAYRLGVVRIGYAKSCPLVDHGLTAAIDRNSRATATVVIAVMFMFTHIVLSWLMPTGSYCRRVTGNRTDTVPSRAYGERAQFGRARWCFDTLLQRVANLGAHVVGAHTLIGVTDRHIEITYRHCILSGCC